ncbi:MAG: GNAT family N-acetyltransferase [Microthrixaceae bacterium]|nr:GNAT family N-acetyltransferase [Microthrixaceae bacterium]MCB9517695.1 GNAT family N-acetyltransferase [Gemmatimonadales bacterium]
MPPPDVLALHTIRLRRPRLADAEAILEYGSDPEVARYADWPIRSDLTALRPLVQDREVRWDAGAEYYWVITERDRDRAIGGISCRITGDAAEVGFLLHRRFWGRGIATEACAAVVAWLWSVPTLRRVWATCDAENLASARVLEKVGLRHERTLPRATVRPNLSPEPRDTLVYARERGGE